jgi:hypothetical protein
MEEMDTLLVVVEDSTDEDVVDSNKADPEARVDEATSDRTVDVEEHLEAVAPANPPTHDLPLNEPLYLRSVDTQSPLEHEKSTMYHTWIMRPIPCTLPDLINFSLPFSFSAKVHQSLFNDGRMQYDAFWACTALRLAVLHFHSKTNHGTDGIEGFHLTNFLPSKIYDFVLFAGMECVTGFFDSHLFPNSG